MYEVALFFTIFLMCGEWMNTLMTYLIKLLWQYIIEGRGGLTFHPMSKTNKWP